MSDFKFQIHIENYDAGHVIIEQGAEEEVLMIVLHGNLILAQVSFNPQIPIINPGV